MTTLLAGMASGVLMAKFFILIGSLTAFAALRNPTPGLTALMERFPPGGLVIALVIIAYPVWTIIGIILALVFVALQNGVPGGGLGSPNIAYTAGVSVAGVAIVLPLAIPFRRFWPALVAMCVTGVGTFGWLLPILLT